MLAGLKVAGIRPNFNGISSKRFNMLQLDQLSDRDLPPLKPAVMRLWQLLNAQNTRLQEISEAMSAEPVLCARIMTIANSPLYRGVEEINSPQKALVRLGLNEVKGIVYYLTLSDSVRKNAFPHCFSMRKFWSHSLCTALLCQKLVQFYPHLFPMNPEEKEGCYLAGILHDIGYVVMASLMPEGFTTLYRQWEDGEQNPNILEEEIFGYSHPVVSAKALKLWKFPKNIQLAVYAHHRAIADNSPAPVIMLLKLADYLATQAGYAFNPLFTPELKQLTLPISYLENDFQPVVQEVTLKVEMLVGQAFA